MNLHAGAKTDVGLTRSNNEDACHLDTGRGLFIVADGMGGHAAGEIASRLAVDTVCDYLPDAGTDNLQQSLRQSVEQANLAVRQAAAEHPDWQGMGTTLSILLIDRGEALLSHVGDSRIYRLRDGCLELLTQDHSLVGEQLRQGILSEQEARDSSLGHILLQAIGISPELDIFQARCRLAAGDRFLLCSDGLTDMLEEEELGVILARDAAPPELCAELIDRALEQGGKDNITVVIVDIDD